MTVAHSLEGTNARLQASRLIRGLYLLTPDLSDTRTLASVVERTLENGARLLQYRNKSLAQARKREQIVELLALMKAYDALLVVNDDWRLGVELGARAIHIGRDDGECARVREEVGNEVVIGVSCYASLQRAADVASDADYLAFGSMFASGTKPQAPSAPLSLLHEAGRLGRPVVAIGGIDRDNIGQVFAAGADAAALIGAVFSAPDPGLATRELLTIVASSSPRHGVDQDERFA